MSDSEKPLVHRRIRSFIRRPGRLTPAQQRALDELLPRYQVGSEITDLRQLFDPHKPLIIEIGCGNGQALAWMAEHESHAQFIGIEVHEPGVGRLLRALAEKDLRNVRVAVRDAVEVLGEQAAPGSIDEVRIYFPDPWPKKRHHKRRLIQPAFLGLIARVLKSGGLLHLATDWMPYAEWMLEALAEVPELRVPRSPFVDRPDWRPQTHFETRGQRRGHRIVDLLVRRA